MLDTRKIVINDGDGFAIDDLKPFLYKKLDEEI